MNRNSGFSVLELVVVFGLLSGLLVLVAMFFTKGRHYAADTESFASVQREAMLTLRRMKEQLSRSTPRHLGLDTDEPEYVYFLSFYPSTSGEPLITLDHQGVLWRKWVCFFYDSDREEVYQADIALTPATASIDTKPSPDVNRLSFSGANPKVIGQHVRDLTFHRFGNSVLVSYVVHGVSPVPLRTEQDKIIEVRIESQIALSN